MSKSVYQLKIVLEDTDPLIWRRIIVPESYSFWDLHVAIQDSMGWQDCHFHSFQVQNKEVGQIIFIGIPDEDMVGSDFETLAAWLISIKKYLRSEGDEIEYTYDFGDDWLHTITLEKILPESPGTAYPICRGGELACPPEDCGGVPGYYDLLEVLSNPDDEEYEEMLEWIGENLNPDDFFIEDVVFDDPKVRFKNMKK